MRNVSVAIVMVLLMLITGCQRGPVRSESDLSLEEVTPVDSPEPVAQGWQRAYAQAFHELIATSAYEPAHLRLVDVDFDHVPELFFSVLGTSNTSIFRGVTYRNQQVEEIQLPSELLPADFELYQDKQTGAYLWMMNGMYREGPTDYNYVWKRVDFSNLNAVTDELFFSWNEHLTVDPESGEILAVVCTLYDEDGAVISGSVEDVERWKAEAFAQYERVPVPVLFQFTDPFLTVAERPISQPDQIELLLDFFAEWEDFLLQYE